MKYCPPGLAMFLSLGNFWILAETKQRTLIVGLRRNYVASRFVATINSWVQYINFASLKLD